MKKAVLIVEDNADQLNMLTQLVLEVNGNTEVYTAQNAGRAYEILMDKTVDVFLIDIILDVNKPGDASGIKLVEKLSITLPIHSLDESIITELASLIKGHPGSTSLYFKVVDSEHNVSLNLFSPNTRLTVTRQLVDYLEENENIDFKINN